MCTTTDDSGASGEANSDANLHDDSNIDSTNPIDSTTPIEPIIPNATVPTVPHIDSTSYNDKSLNSSVSNIDNTNIINDLTTRLAELERQQALTAVNTSPAVKTDTSPLLNLPISPFINPTSGEYRTVNNDSYRVVGYNLRI
jgi:hypothetical protein